jgi:tRNA 2-thiouridine synthesizing protein A
VGLYCPMPIIKTAAKIKEMKTGEVLEVVADDKGIKKDMPAWAEATGNEFLGVEEGSGEIRVYVRKTQK